MSTPATELSDRLTAEGLVWVPRLARRIKAHPSTCLRWVLRGVQRADGSPLQLEGVRIGGRWATSDAAFDRFIRAQQADAQAVPVQLPRTPGQRLAASERAERELIAAGC